MVWSYVKFITISIISTGEAKKDIQNLNGTKLRTKLIILQKIIFYLKYLKLTSVRLSLPVYHFRLKLYIIENNNMMNWLKGMSLHDFTGKRAKEQYLLWENERKTGSYGTKLEVDRKRKEKPKGV